MAALEIHGDRLTFEMATPVEAGNSLRLSMDDGPEIKVYVVHTRPLAHSRYLVVARAPQAIPPDRSEVVLGSRDSARIAERFRVRSPALRHYQGLTVDYSLSGLQVEAEDPLAVGSILPLQLELPTGPDLDIQVEVLWCSPCGDRFRAGCRFLEVSVELRAALNELLEGRWDLPRRVQSPFAHLADPGETLKAAWEGGQEARLEATLSDYEVHADEARLRLTTDLGKLKEIRVSKVFCLRDNRGSYGVHVSYVTSLELNGCARLRFLNSRCETILEIEAAGAIN